jgi:pimeloyl-ACP methyl ester carboxylesterase
MERLFFVHGSVVGGAPTWRAQQALADRYELVVLERPGFPPNPPVDRIDFEADAELVAAALEPGDHLVGHSYGGVITLLAAALRPDALRSLSVIEPPATRVALGDPHADRFAAEAIEAWSGVADAEPDAFLRGFLSAVGSDWDPPSPLPPELDQGARMLMAQRGPWEAEIPLEELSAAPFPTLVVSGAHHPAFEAICDVLERELRAERIVLPGYGHTVQRHPDFNPALADFVDRASQRR